MRHNSAVIFVDGVEVQRLKLDEPTDIILNETHIRVRGGAVNFEAAKFGRLSANNLEAVKF